MPSPPSTGRRLKVRRVALDVLHLDPANARAHGQINLAAIKASLQRFGQAEPLVVQAGTGRVIAGNGRLVAMRELGWTACDVVELDVEGNDATALGLALNRTAELAEWNTPALARLLEQLRAEDALEGVGFTGDEIDALLAELAGGPAGEVDDPGPGEPPSAPVSRPGDLWVLGAHRLRCGDSTRTRALSRLLGGEKAALLATDPPYCVNYTGADRPERNGKPGGKDWSHVYREVDIKDLGEFLDGFLTAALPHVIPAAPVYVWHAHVQQPVIARVFEKHGILFHQVIVWVKPTAVFGHSYFQWRHEPCAFGWRKGNKPKHGTAQLTSVWEVDWEGKQRFSGDHPTTKPTRLFEIPMELHTKAGDIVLEPFCGSGSQIIAAEKLGRRCRAMEIQPAFVDVAVRRWEAATKGTATLDATGATFAEVAAERGRIEPDPAPDRR